MSVQKRKAIIVDLDGTLCNIDHRRPLLEKKDWKEFFASMVFDTPNAWCNDLIFAINETFTWQIIFVSGRPEDYRPETLEWFNNHLDIDTPMAEIKLFMRPAGDFRKDSEIKKEIYLRDIEPHYDVLFCIDDRQQVVDQWRELGLVCLQCAKGDY